MADTQPYNAERDEAEDGRGSNGAAQESTTHAPTAPDLSTKSNGLTAGNSALRHDSTVADLPEQTARGPPEALSAAIDNTVTLRAPSMLTAFSTTGAEAMTPFPELEVDPTLSIADGEGWNDSFEASQPDGTQSMAASEEHQIQAFAKLEFDDGEFYMNTYAVELGRDLAAARRASQANPPSGEGSLRKRSGSSGGESVKSARLRRSRGRFAGGSIVSESGGVIGVDPLPSDSEKRPFRSKAKSTSSSSQQLSRKSSIHLPKTDYNALALESLPEYATGTNGIDGRNALPSPDLTPLIPIHPPAAMDGVSTGHKSISRKHIRIAFNFEKHLFEVEILGRNGAFVDEVYYASGDIHPLRSGSVIQIGGVGIRFVLPDVPAGKTGAEVADGSDPLSGGKMRLDMADSGEDDEDEEDNVNDVNGTKEPNADELPVRGRGKEKTSIDPEIPKPKRKGPGRPPKNGIISKREQALLARQAREEAKAAAEGRTKPSQGRGKGKTVKAVEAEASNLQPNGKRKYTKRKRAGADIEQQVRDSTEQTDSVPPDQGSGGIKVPKEKSKAIKPPRSPSPVFDESKLTPEQLAKPQQSYVVLIHEALSNSKTGQMSLPQIYRAIERRYPFFKLRVQTQGWQSSVRHNLSQHAAFKKIERDGKGWMWGLVAEVSIEKEKKRRPTPPPQPPPQYYQPPPPPAYPSHGYPYPALPALPNGHMQAFPFGMAPRPAFPPTLGPNGYPISLVKPPSESTYKSPYESSAPDTAIDTAQSVPAVNGMNGSRPSPSAPSSESPAYPPVEAPTAPIGVAATAQMSANALGNDTTEEKHDKDVFEAVNKFKTTLMASMPDKAYAEQLVPPLINKFLSSPSSRESAGEGTDERAITAALSNILSALQERKKAELGPSVSSRTRTDSDAAPDTAKVQGDTVAEMAADIAKKIPLTNGGDSALDGTLAKTKAEPTASSPPTAAPAATPEKESEVAKVDSIPLKATNNVTTTTITNNTATPTPTPPTADTGMELRGRRRKRAGSDEDAAHNERGGRGLKKVAP